MVFRNTEYRVGHWAQELARRIRNIHKLVHAVPCKELEAYGSKLM